VGEKKSGPQFPPREVLTGLGSVVVVVVDGAVVLVHPARTTVTATAATALSLRTEYITAAVRVPKDGPRRSCARARH